MYVCMYVYMYSRTYEMKNRPNFEEAPHGSAIVNEESMKFCGCSAGSAIFFKIFRMLRMGARFSSKFSGCSARERDFSSKQDDLERSILV